MIALPPRPSALLADLDPFGRLFVTAFNLCARGPAMADTLTELEGKRVCIRATDLPLTIRVEIRERRLKPAPPGAEPHVTLRGRFRDFARLAVRAEDPDTLFFQRRLSFEGETETGLAIKNALDALEWAGPCAARGPVPQTLAAALRAARRLLPPPPWTLFEQRTRGPR